MTLCNRYQIHRGIFSNERKLNRFDHRCLITLNDILPQSRFLTSIELFTCFYGCDELELPHAMHLNLPIGQPLPYSDL